MKRTFRQKRSLLQVRKKKPVYLKAVSLPDSRLRGVTKAVPEFQPPAKLAEPKT